MGRWSTAERIIAYSVLDSWQPISAGPPAATSTDPTPPLRPRYRYNGLNRAAFITVAAPTGAELADRLEIVLLTWDGAILGGPVAVEGDAQRGARTVDAIFEVTLALTDAPDGWIGERAWVRFAHPAEPLARQWGRSARQLLVRFFEGQ